jgi:hypothetical protein
MRAAIHHHLPQRSRKIMVLCACICTCAWTLKVDDAELTLACLLAACILSLSLSTISSYGQVQKYECHRNPCKELPSRQPLSDHLYISCMHALNSSEQEGGGTEGGWEGHACTSCSALHLSQPMGLLTLLVSQTSTSYRRPFVANGLARFPRR